MAVNDGTDPFFNPAGGVMGAVDIQLRNSDKSHPGVRKVSGFPPHLHIKNMEVHPSMRNKGVGLGKGYNARTLSGACSRPSLDATASAELLGSNGIS